MALQDRGSEVRPVSGGNMIELIVPLIYLIGGVAAFVWLIRELTSEWGEKDDK